MIDERNRTGSDQHQGSAQSNLLLCVLVTVAFSCFFASTLLVRNGSLNLSVVAHDVSRWTQIVVCFILAFHARSFRIHPNRLFLIALCSFVLSVGLHYAYTFDIGPLGTDAADAIIEPLTGMFDGIQLACFSLLLAYSLCLVKPRQASVMIPVGFAGEHLIFLSSGGVPASYGAVLKLIVVLIYVAALFIVLRLTPGVRTAHGSDLSTSAKLSIKPLLDLKNYFPLYLGMLIFPLLYGFMAQICSSSEIDSGLFSSSTEVVGITFLLILAAFNMFKSERIDTEKAFAVLLPIFTTAFLFLPFFWDKEVFVAGFIMKCGFLIYCAFMWICLQKICATDPQNSFFYFGIAMGLFHLTLVGGRQIAKVLIAQQTVSHEMLAVCSLAAIWVLSIAMFVVMAIALRRKRAETAEKSAESPVIITTSAFETACDRFTERFGLSKRESVILKGYASGRSEESIAEAEFVSKETVKTHIKRIYAKSGCHSRQDLIDTLDTILDGDKPAAEPSLPRKSPLRGDRSDAPRSAG